MSSIRGPGPRTSRVRPIVPIRGLTSCQPKWRVDMRVVSRAFLVVLLLVSASMTGRAAGVLLQGTVVDPAGSVIPGATVELSTAARVVATAVSAADGTFKFPDVAPGN